MTILRHTAIAAGLALALTSGALAAGRGGGGGGGNDSGSGLNPNTQLSGNDRSAGVNSGNYDPSLRFRLNRQGWNGYGRPPGGYGDEYGYGYAPARGYPRRAPTGPFEGYPY